MIILNKKITGHADVTTSYLEYIESINGLYGLSDRERLVLALLAVFEDKYITLGNKNIITADSRKWLVELTGINKFNLSRYISKLKSKDLIIQVRNGYVIDRTIIPFLTNFTDYDLDICITIKSKNEHKEKSN